MVGMVTGLTVLTLLVQLFFTTAVQRSVRETVLQQEDVKIPGKCKNDDGTTRVG